MSILDELLSIENKPYQPIYSGKNDTKLKRINILVDKYLL